MSLSPEITIHTSNKSGRENYKMTKIGVFDSGVGGLSVANAIKVKLQGVEVLLREDKENLPYGAKTPDELYLLVKPILLEMQAAGCEIIVIACNTVTTNIMTRLAATVSIPLIGMEPMVEAAATLTKSGVITVCATQATLSSDRYKQLKLQFCDNIAVSEPDCSTWAQMIENNDINHEHIRNIIKSEIEKGSDVIVLGCTHYHWIRGFIIDVVNDKAIVIQPEQEVIFRLQEVIPTL